MGGVIERSLCTRGLATLVALGLFPRILAAAPDIALQMSVDVAVPSAGQPVEFTVKASNVGDAAAAGVVVNDKLPAELAIPAGRAVFTSVGTYDTATGAWSVGALDPGTSATLVIPAIVVAPTQPPCIVNIAETSHSLDTQRGNNRTLVAVRRTGTDRCVDLKVTAFNTSGYECGNSMRLSYAVSVSNAGPDDASNVFVDLSQTPVIAPNLRFTGTNCSGLRCVLATLASGTSSSLEVTSDSFSNNKDRSVMLLFATSSSDADYSTSNNQFTIERSLPALQKCISVDEGWDDVIAASGFRCFIATAAYGSPLEPHVVALREFRDRYLQRSAAGRAFIRFYYRHSPPVAAVIAEHEWLRFLARMLLTPLVLAVAFPLRAGALLAVLAVLAGYASKLSRAGRFSS
jgi:uncharacterized repeat protein (TIGR01451 family)